MEQLPSLLMAVLAPHPPGPYSQVPEPEPDPKLEENVVQWIGESEAKKELMLQALYGALPYALTNEQAARVVGRLLARGVGGSQAALPADPEGIRELRREIREDLRKRFEKLKAKIP
jgi:hypothetical protein